MGIPVGVIGAGGYVGGELLRLLAGHPDFDLSYAAASGRDRGQDDPLLAAVHPAFRGGEMDGPPDGGPRLAKTSVTEAARRCSAVFLATPPEVSATLAASLLTAGVDAVIDLSPAFRLDDPEAQHRWYPDVRRPPGCNAVYGLPELNRDALAGASLIAAPGCMATAAILALLPLCDVRGLALDAVVIDAKVGSTGSGNRLRKSGMHPVRSGAVAPYAPAGHRHAAEISAVLRARGLTAGVPGLRLGMSVYGIDLVRGLSVAVYALQNRHDRPDQPGELALTGLFREFYRKEPFVRIRDWPSEAVPLPDPKAVIGSNYCDIAAFHDIEAGRIVVIAALDNLMKGAAGQAVQACNIRYGLPETTGLSALPLYPA